MLYSLRIDYYCPLVKNGGKWFLIESETEPELNSKVRDFLPPHRCCKDEYSQDCMEDLDCTSQVIIEIKKGSLELALT